MTDYYHTIYDIHTAVDRAWFVVAVGAIFLAISIYLLVKSRTPEGLAQIESVFPNPADRYFTFRQNAWLTAVFSLLITAAPLTMIYLDRHELVTLMESGRCAVSTGPLRNVAIEESNVRFTVAEKTFRLWRNSTKGYHDIDGPFANGLQVRIVYCRSDDAIVLFEVRGK